MIDRDYRQSTIYWLIPVKMIRDDQSEKIIKKLLLHRKIFGFGDKTRGRKALNIRDEVCFYSSGVGIIATARVKTKPRRDSKIISEEFPWVFKLENVSLFLESPISFKPKKRFLLDAFKGDKLEKHWAWFVQGPHRLTEHDFKILINK